MLPVEFFVFGRKDNSYGQPFKQIFEYLVYSTQIIRIFMLVVSIFGNIYFDHITIWFVKIKNKITLRFNKFKNLKFCIRNCQHNQ